MTTEQKRNWSCRIEGALVFLILFLARGDYSITGIIVSAFISIVLFTINSIAEHYRNHL